MTTAIPANPIGLRFMGVSKCLFDVSKYLFKVLVGGLATESQPPGRISWFGIAAKKESLISFLRAGR
jgi:hypothetical protein